MHKIEELNPTFTKPELYSIGDIAGKLHEVIKIVNKQTEMIKKVLDK